MFLNLIIILSDYKITFLFDTSYVRYIVYLVYSNMHFDFKNSSKSPHIELCVTIYYLKKIVLNL